ncbi:isocitrate/isopropylmalate dehydrogenase family protein [Gluconacetobacter azotocaptans]|uniref:isocitrate/isopropylmalate dehydrogenase family protein n=1 Tax=Gluconacetobacter azotocaptans TaxID=142834 RepID=UPI0019574E1C|nr:isocitrate/isopropylmalate family dehydrogenase [Gluconacetobacter azotocaptans]MBM9400789.1 isocitrate/isopropylmalate dehydrogenase family protein [Gluconacetobacter azotocaptans]
MPVATHIAPRENPQKAPLSLLGLPGDGIGPEVLGAALPIFDAMRIPIKLDIGKIGWSCWQAAGDPVPQDTWEKISHADVVLLSAITSKSRREAEDDLPPHLRQRAIEYVSPVIQLRQRLDLYANVRPIYDLSGRDKFRAVVIRENTEGLYSGLDYWPAPAPIVDLLAEATRAKPLGREHSGHISASVRIQTRHGLSRIFLFAFEFARQNGYRKVTLADKPNVLRHSGAFARECFEEAAEKFPEIIADVQNVDAVALWLVMRPERFGVIVAENMFGDILSDLAAGVMGGLGFAPSENIGTTGAYYEPVHGSAPHLAGQNRANPSAMFLTIALALKKHGYGLEAAAIQRAVSACYQAAKVTYDAGGSLSTAEAASEIISRAAHDAETTRCGHLPGN